MASLFHLNQLLHTTILLVTSLNSTPSISPPTITISFKNKHVIRRSIVVADAFRWFEVANTKDDELDPKSNVAVAVVKAAETVTDSETEKVTSETEIVKDSETERLKKALVGSFYGTDRRLKVMSETRTEIVELITQLEAKNPTPASTDSLSLLNGKWILAYTSFACLLPLLSSGLLSLFSVEEISQTIDSESLTVQISTLLAGLLTTTSISINAKFEVRSPNRLLIKFEEGVIGTPQPIDSLEIPENVEFLG